MSIDIIGDRWTLLILRDMMFDNRRHFGQLLVSAERIASNVLADRLKMLIAEGIVSRRDHPTHKQKAIYSLTESMLNERGQAILKGGPRAWSRFMANLRKVHLDASPARRFAA
jgi:DNA-binding HxlR family transcriptional regulator